MTIDEMTIEEAIEYFTNRNADIESAAMDEDKYHYGKKQIEDVRMRREFEANELAINALEEQKNITNEKIEQTSWVVGKDGAKVAFQDMPIEKAKRICEILASDMREPTEEERKSTTKYIDSISKPTGVKFDEEIENCRDCIDRNELLRYMENTEISQFLDEINNGNDNYSSCDLYEYVQEMPHVTPQQRWVPVGEGLPEEDGLYLVSIRYDIMGRVTVCSDWGEWNDGEWICDFGYCSESEKVIAWSSLPKPYKEDKNGV